MQAVLILANKIVEQVIGLSKLLSLYFRVDIHFDKKYQLSIEMKRKLESIDGVHVSHEMIQNGEFHSARKIVPNNFLGTVEQVRLQMR